jgi:hypothetical protein
VGKPTILAAMEVASNDNGVRVEFTKVDRVISHTIYEVNAGKKTPVLESLSGSASQPCFTELHQQGDMLFLTGADGPCHWSMSVESRQNSPGSSLLFDVACRIKEPGLKLSTVYAVLSTGAKHGFLINSPAADGATGCSIKSNALRVCIMPTAVLPNTMPATVRWKYGVS